MLRITTLEMISNPSSRLKSTVHEACEPNRSALSASWFVGCNELALHEYARLNHLLANGFLEPATRTRIAIAIANMIGCMYCNCVQTRIARESASLSADELEANRRGYSNDPKANHAVQFVVAVTARNGSVTDAEIRSLLDSGYSDAEVDEIVAHISLNTGLTVVNENNSYAPDRVHNVMSRSIDNSLSSQLSKTEKPLCHESRHRPR